MGRDADLKSRRVRSGEHELHVVHGGQPQKPLVLFLHGYPDSHRVWRELMVALSDEYQVVAFDLKGVGESGPPAPAAHYRIDRLLPDIAAVLSEFNGDGAKAHLVGHDWGSTVGWSFVCHPEYQDRVLSWTTISGPHLGMWYRWMADGIKSLRPRRMGQVVWQLIKSSYVLLLLAWPIPELLWGLGGTRAWRWVLRLAGVPKDDPMLDETRAKVLSMTLRPMALYRRNIFCPPPVPEPRSITTPIHLIIPTGDPFVSESVYDDIERYVVHLTKLRVDASHWAPRSHPSSILDLLREFLRSSGAAS